MTLSEVLERLDEFDENLTIYAQGSPSWQPSSEAIVAEETEDGEPPPEAKGMSYLLEVYLAKEVLEVWSQWRNGSVPSSDDRCEAVIHYAKNDAYKPVDGE